ncbi:hypothetical protein JCM19232_5007 [Vibrio ishigakensis]|uniref:Uncharacterized protein n=1 Tax=Vibrio ishigakensis TaxID=1481914 RepID=A0A0B8PLB1_9VIBR|nr:hypothetical protein JCM19232_5007 [Vibrio ishigakensis]
MPTYAITYIDKDGQTLKSETVLMMNLPAVKRSASSQAPMHTVLIEIKDILGLVIARKVNHTWQRSL